MPFFEGWRLSYPFRREKKRGKERLEMKGKKIINASRGVV